MSEQEAKAKDQYPRDWNPPLRGKCEVCGYITKGFQERWLSRCPQHWQALSRPVAPRA